MVRRNALPAIALALAVASPAAAAPPDGATVFKQRCTTCHSIDPAPGKMGPPLKGVVGRKAATTPGYAYSAALKKAQLTWTPAQLDKFIKAPGQTVPGTKMVLGLPNDEQRAAVIAYLGTAK